LTIETNAVRMVLIALADQGAQYRIKLAEALRQDPALRLLGGDLTPEDTVATLERECPDVLLLAAHEDHAPALAILEKLHAIKCATKIVLLVSTENLDFFVRAVRVGCRGILQKESPADLVLKCIRKVNFGWTAPLRLKCCANSPMNSTRPGQKIVTIKIVRSAPANER